MKVVILIFILPQEISELQTILHTFSNSQKLLSENFDWTVDVCMSVSPELINWERSIIKKEFFEEKLYNLEKRTTWCNTNFTTSKEVRGALEYRRSIQEKKYDDSDYIILVDSDMIFCNETLSLFEKAMTELHNKTPYLQITPEYTKLWGEPWDFVMNEKYKNEDNKYSLYAVCNHGGVTQGGHYTVNIKNANNKWYNYNDTTVREIKEEQVVSAKAYCVFYRKLRK